MKSKHLKGSCFPLNVIKSKSKSEWWNAEKQDREPISGTRSFKLVILSQSLGFFSYKPLVIQSRRFLLNNHLRGHIYVFIVEQIFVNTYLWWLVTLIWHSFIVNRNAFGSFIQHMCFGMKWSETLTMEIFVGRTWTSCSIEECSDNFHLNRWKLRSQLIDELKHRTLADCRYRNSNYSVENFYNIFIKKNVAQHQGQNSSEFIKIRNIFVKSFIAFSVFCYWKLFQKLQFDGKIR